MIVIKYLFNFVLRGVFIFYGLNELLGILWYVGSIYTSDLVEGVLLAFTSLFVGGLPLSLINTKERIAAYIVVCVIGITTSAYSIYEDMAYLYTNLPMVKQLILLQAIIIILFIIMAVRVIKPRIKESDAKG